MTNQINYKDYVGSVIFSEEDDVFHGKVLGISSSISFEGNSVKALKEDFHRAIDEYLDYCSQVNVQPEKSSFTIQLSPEIYGKAAISASQKGIPVSKYVEKAIEASVFA